MQDTRTRPRQWRWLHCLARCRTTPRWHGFAARAPSRGFLCPLSLAGEGQVRVGNGIAWRLPYTPQMAWLRHYAGTRDSGPRQGFRRRCEAGVTFLCVAKEKVKKKATLTLFAPPASGALGSPVVLARADGPSMAHRRSLRRPASRPGQTGSPRQTTGGNTNPETPWQNNAPCIWDRAWKSYFSDPALGRC